MSTTEVNLYPPARFHIYTHARGGGGGGERGERDLPRESLAQKSEFCQERVLPRETCQF